MKLIKILLTLSAFLIMIACVVNIINTIPGASKLGIYLDFCAMGIIATCIGIVSLKERKARK